MTMIANIPRASITPVHAPFGASRFTTLRTGGLMPKPQRCNLGASRMWIIVGLAGFFAWAAIGPQLLPLSDTQQAPVATPY